MNNTEKFAIELGFDNKDLAKLKELLKLQEKFENNNKKRPPKVPSQDDKLALEIRRNNFANKAEKIAEKAGLAKSRVAELRAEAYRLHGTTKLATAQMAEFNDRLRQEAVLHRKAATQVRKHNIAVKGLNDSTKHLVRSYASVFAVLGATSAINKTGQQFEAVNSAMLAAMGTTEAAAGEMAFLDNLTSDLGLSLLDSADAYTKFLFAAKGKLDISETRELFTGLSELGTTLGVSKERMALSMTAIQQINS